MLCSVLVVRIMDLSAAMAWPAWAAQHNQKTTGQKTTVVVLHADPGLRQALSFALQVEGYCVRVHGRAQEYLAAPSPPRPAIMVVDEALPGVSGLDAYRAFTKHDRALPAILLATPPTAALRQGAVLTGIAEIVEKPLLGTALTDALKRLSLRQNF